MKRPDKLEITTDAHTVYKVRNTKDGWTEWADIYVNAGHGWVTVTIRSDFHNVAFHWSNIGSDPWWEFLNRISLDYAMTKFMGRDACEWDEEKTLAAIVMYVNGCSYPDSVAEDAFYHMNERCDPSIGWDAYLMQLCEHDIFSSIDDIYDFKYNRIKPSVQAMWDRIWRPWIMKVANDETLRSAVKL